MRNKIIISMLLILLFGCASQPAFNDFQSKEKLLLQTGNYKKLVPLYKNKLAEHDAHAIRLKLAEAYLKSGDPESALFTVAPLIRSKNKNVQAFIIQAHSQHELGDLERALRSAKIANNMEKNNPEVENLLGVIYAANSDYIKARRYFNLSRDHLYDDIKVKNNLAVLDIIEGQYKKAVQRLLPIYLNANADPQVKANLLLAMAKLGNYDYVQTLLAGKYSEREIADRYDALKNIAPLSVNNTRLLSDKNAQVEDIE